MRCLANNGTFVPDKGADEKAGIGAFVWRKTVAEFGGIPPRFTPASLVGALIPFRPFGTISPQ